VLSVLSGGRYNAPISIFFFPSKLIVPDIKKHLRILNMNFQSLKKKGKLIEAIIESTEADMIIGTETWLDSNIKSSEIIPDYFQYDMAWLGIVC
jgi:hypothetical protein